MIRRHLAKEERALFFQRKALDSEISKALSNWGLSLRVWVHSFLTRSMSMKEVWGWSADSSCFGWSRQNRPCFLHFNTMLHWPLDVGTLTKEHLERGRNFVINAKRKTISRIPCREMSEHETVFTRHHWQFILKLVFISFVFRRRVTHVMIVHDDNHDQEGVDLDAGQNNGWRW